MDSFLGFLIPDSSSSSIVFSPKKCTIDSAGRAGQSGGTFSIRKDFCHASQNHEMADGLSGGKAPCCSLFFKGKTPFLSPASPVHHPDCRTGCRALFLAQPIRQTGGGKSGPGTEPDHGPAENQAQNGGTEADSPPGRTETGPAHEQTNRRSPAPADPAPGPHTHRSQGQGPDSAHDPTEGEVGLLQCNSHGQGPYNFLATFSRL